MPQLAEVVLTDSNDEEQTFTPRGITGGVATLVKSTGVPVADLRLTASHNRTPSSGREKVIFNLTLPVVQDAVVSGISRPTVVRTAYVAVQFTFEPTSSTLERSDAIAYVASLLGTDMALQLVNNLADLY